MNAAETVTAPARVRVDGKQSLIEIEHDKWVDLNTEAGALEFVEHTGGLLCCSENAKYAMESRNFMDLVILTALPRGLAENHASLFSDKEISDVQSIFTTLLLELAAKDSFQESGQLDDFYNGLFAAVASWSSLPKFTKSMLQASKSGNGGYRALVKVMKAPIGRLPGADLCEHVLTIIEQAYVSCFADSSEETFMYKLDKTGLLAQGLRALTGVAVAEEHQMDIVNHVMRDHNLIKKRLRKGMATRVVLDGLLDDGDCASNVRERLTLLAEKCDLPPEQLDGFNMSFCRNCKVTLKKMKVCKQCKSVSYCGRDCQVADWKQHKKYCKKYKGDTQKNVQLSHVTQQWVQGHLFDIMTEVGTMSRATGLEQKDLCILIDLVDYKDPPIVIKKVKDVLKGREMPKWNGTENNSEFRAAIKERYESHGQWVVVVSAPQS